MTPTLINKFSFEFRLWIFAFGMACAFVVLGIFGHSDSLKVRDFSWEKIEVSPMNQQMSFVFNEVPDRQAVEASLVFSPQIKWRSSWLGRKWIVTLEEPLQHGQSYEVEIPLAHYGSYFETSSKRLFYIDSSREDQRLLVELKTQTGEQSVVSPADLAVVDYEFNPKKEEVVMLATPVEQLLLEGEMNVVPNLYRLDLKSKKAELLAGTEHQVNFNFAISPDGERIVLDRLSLDMEGSPNGRGLYIHSAWRGWTQFWQKEAVGDVLQFAPDSSWLLLLDMNRFTMVPLNASDGEPQLIGEYFNSYGFSRDGALALFTQWAGGAPYATTNELVVLHSDGRKENLLQNIGEIQNVIFSPEFEVYYLLIRPEGAGDTRLYRYDGETLESLSQEDDFLEQDLSLSWDGQTLAMQRDKYDAPGDGGLWLYEIETGEWIDLGQQARLPKWAP
jgi:hypothetical protein